ncbi:MAG: glutamine ABC transporter substrate-binding protein GlnH [Rickettsiales bacterium]|nr:MAG: glutamine ABC transporter substrate-binding protein GlnH [Rickettsiales bacterium]
MRKIYFLSILVAIGLIFALNINANSVKENNVLVIGTDPQYAPFTFENEKGENVGFDIDIMSEICKELDYKCKYSNMNFGGLITSITENKIDLIAGSMVITDERRKKIDFTEQYYKAGLSVVVGKNNTNILSVDDLKGKRVGVHIGTVGAIYANNLKGIKLTEFETMADVWIALITDKVDAIIDDHPMVLYYIKTQKNANIKIVGDILETQYFGFGINKNNKELLKKVDEALKQMKKDGRYNKIHKKWF